VVSGECSNLVEIEKDRTEVNAKCSSPVEKEAENTENLKLAAFMVMANLIHTGAVAGVPENAQKEKSNAAQRSESMDQQYSNFIDECLKVIRPAEPWHFPDEEMKPYLLSQIRDSKLSINLRRERRNIERLRMLTLIKNYRVNPPFDRPKSGNLNSQPQHRR